MNQLRASRLSGGRKKPKFLSEYFPEDSNKRKVFFYFIFPAFFLILSYWSVDSVIMPSVTRHGTEFPLPDFVGLKIDEAEKEIKDLTLLSEINSEEYSPGLAKGIIMSQFPYAGTRIKKDRTIKFVISQGQKYIPIPQMGGRSVRQAMLDLEAAGLILGEIAWAFSDTLPEKVVVFSYPATGTEIPLGSPVNIMVNRGRASRFTYMPDIIGLPLSEAVKKIEDKSLRLGIVTYRTDENYLPETVLEQSESEGNELDVGTEIDLVVSSTE